MTKQERVAERQSNIAMLSDLLEASLGYDKRAQDCAAKKAEIERLDRELGKERPKRFKPLWLFIIIGIITMFIGLIVMFVINMIDKKKWEERCARLRAQKEAAKKAYDAAYADLNKYDAEVFQPKIAKYVPDSFALYYARNSFAIQYMLDMLKNLRADTIREAINVYEDAMHHARVEKALASVANLSVEIAKNTARSAAANEVAAKAAVATAANTAAIAASSAATAYHTAVTADNTSKIANNTDSIKRSMAGDTDYNY